MIANPVKSPKYVEFWHESVASINAGIINGSVNIDDKILIFNPKVIEELSNSIGATKQIKTTPTNTRYGTTVELISRIIQTKGNTATIAII